MTKKAKIRNNTYGTLVIVAMIGVVAVLGLFSVMAFGRSSDSNGTTAAAATINQQQGTAAVTTFATTFFQKYTAAASNPSPVLQQYGDTNAVNGFGMDTRDCAPNIPNSVSVNLVRAGTDSFTANVTYNYTDSAGVGVNVLIVPHGNSYQIDSASCV